MGGLRLAGYYAVGDAFHIGGWFGFGVGDFQVCLGEWGCDEGNENRLVMGGLAMRFGGRVGNVVWLGGALDFGGYGSDAEDSDDSTAGIVLSPRLDLDIMLVQTAFKMALSLGAGATIVPYGEGTVYGTDGTVNYIVVPQILVGLALGG
ncbi:MAG: hypothetical protein GYA57_11390 [Myxococcales bacterium]|nr:hypothetical protein [Myxococcales bacterium]